MTDVLIFYFSLFQEELKNNSKTKQKNKQKKYLKIDQVWNSLKYMGFSITSFKRTLMQIWKSPYKFVFI